MSNGGQYCSSSNYFDICDRNKYGRLFMPAVYELYYNQSLWEEAPAEALATRDNIYATFLSLPLFMIGAVFLWSYISTSRKDYGY